MSSAWSLWTFSANIHMQRGPFSMCMTGALQRKSVQYQIIPCQVLPGEDMCLQHELQVLTICGRIVLEPHLLMHKSNYLISHDFVEFAIRSLPVVLTATTFVALEERCIIYLSTYLVFVSGTTRSVPGSSSTGDGSLAKLDIQKPCISQQ